MTTDSIRAKAGHHRQAAVNVMIEKVLAIACLCVIESLSQRAKVLWCHPIQTAPKPGKDLSLTGTGD